MPFREKREFDSSLLFELLVHSLAGNPEEKDDSLSICRDGVYFKDGILLQDSNLEIYPWLNAFLIS